MKKIALCSLMAVMITDVAFSAGCPSTFTPGNNNWRANSNEYLFPTGADWRKAKNRAQYYKCDSAWCKDSTYVTMPAGHVWKGTVVNSSRTYKCIAPTVGNDRWEATSTITGLTKCTKKVEGWGLFDGYMNDDEFLYESKEEFDSSQGNAYGTVYECDSNACSFGTVKTMNPGHYFGGNKINKKQCYKCMDGDYWEEVACSGGSGPNPDPKCKSDEDLAKQDFTSISACNGAKCTIKKGQCVNSNMLRCIEAAARGEPANWNGVSCNCGDRLVWDSKRNTCYGGAKPPKKTCKETYKGYPERIKCCEAGKATRWEGDIKSGKCICIDVSKVWENGKCEMKKTQTCEEIYKDNDDAIACCKAEDASWDSDLQRCVCNEENKTWNKETKKCEANTSGGGEDVLTDCEYTRDVQIKCYNGNSYTEKLKFKLTQEQVRKLEKKDCKEIKDDTKIPDDILAQTNEYISRFNALCGSATVQTADHTREISDARSKLERFFSTTESNASVWKDAEGNFNKARLVSDATAGVVLGTVGGVVSSKIIKKKQLEKGYDVLHCTVGGQTVADWGDEFNVSMGRR